MTSKQNEDDNSANTTEISPGVGDHIKGYWGHCNRCGCGHFDPDTIQTGEGERTICATKFPGVAGAVLCGHSREEHEYISR
ncbi:MAG TPA: hypothetical protein VIZ65_00405 [Cellvibrionaceae bacterium]